MARGKHSSRHLRLSRHLRHPKCLMDAAAPSIEHTWYYLVASPGRGPGKHLAVAEGYPAHPRWVVRPSFSDEGMCSKVTVALTAELNPGPPVILLLRGNPSRTATPDRIAAQHTSRSI